MTLINIRELKKIARKLDDPLKSLVLSEPDEMEIEDLISRGDLWLKLCEIQEGIKIEKTP